MCMFVLSYAETTYNLNEIADHQFVVHTIIYKLMFTDFIQIVYTFSIGWYKHTHSTLKIMENSVLYVD